MQDGDASIPRDRGILTQGGEVSPNWGRKKKKSRSSTLGEEVNRHLCTQASRRWRELWRVLQGVRRGKILVRRKSRTRSRTRHWQPPTLPPGGSSCFRFEEGGEDERRRMICREREKARENLMENSLERNFMIVNGSIRRERLKWRWELKFNANGKLNNVRTSLSSIFLLFFFYNISTAVCNSSSVSFFLTNRSIFARIISNKIFYTFDKNFTN